LCSNIQTMRWKSEVKYKISLTIVVGVRC
jgi:hypothetical protein